MGKAFGQHARQLLVVGFMGRNQVKIFLHARRSATAALQRFGERALCGFEMCHLSVKQAKVVEGIKSVDAANLKTKPLPPPPSAPIDDVQASDPMKKGTIDEVLKKMGISGVNVAVKDGEVTLTGTVAKDRLAEVMKAAQEADVKKVNNKLTIK